MKLQDPKTPNSGRRGIAMIAVLVVLLAIFALCAPFLMSVRNADRASAELSDRAAARLALDSGLRHARAQLGDSHPGVDRTPYYDSEDEFELNNSFPEELYRADDPKGAMWDVEAEDLAGRIDLNSASHQMLANLFGIVARSIEETSDEARQIEVTSGSGFAPVGFFWMDGELISYASFEDAEFKQLTRGLLYEKPEKDGPPACGPGMPADHSLGTYVVDQRSFALPLWRMFNGTPGQLARLDSLEQVGEARPFSMIEELPTGYLGALERTCSVFAHLGAGSKWQRPTRLLRQVDGEDKPGCRFELADTRFINVGATIRISDGQRVEFGIVRRVNGERVTLMERLVNVYEPERTTVSVLARRPVNINTASPEVLHALMVNLKLVGRRARITNKEARDLVKVIVASRPFTGFEDLVKRLILPAGGFKSLPDDAPVVPALLAELKSQGTLQDDGQRSVVGFIDEDDARALYKNARNANDRELEWSTMPFCFTSRDVYRLEMRASVNAKSGVERSQRVREQVELIVPQKPLFSLWHRQADFEEETRLDRAGQGWVSGPEPTARSSGRNPSRMPSRSLAHLGNFDSDSLTQKAKEEGTPAIQTFPTLEGDAWLQLAPARTWDLGLRQGRVLHFDFETRNLEGHYLPEGTLDYRADDPLVRFTGSSTISSSLESVSLGVTGGSSDGTLTLVLQPSNGLGTSSAGAGPALMNAVQFEMWIKPEGIQPGANLLSAGGGFSNSGAFGLSDMVELLFDDTDLVLRVRSGLPDHPLTEFEELAEVRYPLSGLPVDVWTHVSASIAGTRPDQLRLMVDGRQAPRSTGLTRLAQPLGSDGTQIAVESTEGFPDTCVLLIGDELIEATKTSAGGFEAIFHATGAQAGFGGRLARETFRNANPEQNAGLASKQTSYPSGTSVQLYGYSLPLASELSGLRATLASPVGAFAVGRAVGLREGGNEHNIVPVGGSGKEDAQPAITVDLSTLGSPFAPTVGFGLPGDLEVEEIFIEPADAAMSRAQTLDAFSRRGGYALLVSQGVPSFSRPGTSVSGDRDPNGYSFGGLEVIRYSGVTERGIVVTARGDDLPELSLDPSLVLGKRSFIFQYDETVNDTFEARNQQLSSQTFVIPLSIPITGSVPTPNLAGRPSEFIQLTHVGGDADLTEWVRYDRVARGSVVRVDAEALLRAQVAVLAGTIEVMGVDLTPRPPNPDPRLPDARPAAAGESRSPAMAPAPVPSAQQAGAYWYYAMGRPEFAEGMTPVTEAVASALQFRGVLGTYSHAHQPSTLVLPVFRLPSGDVQNGMPGRFDPVMLFEQLSGSTSSGVPGRVQRAHRASQHLVLQYMDSGILTGATAGNPVAVLQDQELMGMTFVALDDFTARIANSNALLPSNQTGAAAETRSLARMAKFPSGERPRAMESVSLGGSFSGQGSVASAVIDEVVFSNPLLNHQKVLDADVAESAASLRVRGRRYPGGDVNRTNGALRGMQAGSGLIRLGDEIMAYFGLDMGGNVIVVSEYGRGLLGSTPQPHAAGESISAMPEYTVGTLLAAIDADSAYLPIDGGAFPPEGLVLVGDELIHYTRVRNGRLEMPIGSEQPGRRDLKGPGLFRGRFGTDRSSHPAGVPVILFPFRYWDRWSADANAPELDFFEFSLDQPGAFLGNVFWDVDEGPQGGVRLGVLQRLGRRANWDADPQTDDALDLMYRGLTERGGNPIGAQADSAQWRVFVEYERGAFDARGGLSHAWKTTPKLTRFGVEYVAPGLALQRIDR